MFIMFLHLVTSCLRRHLQHNWLLHILCTSGYPFTHHCGMFGKGVLLFVDLNLFSLFFQGFCTSPQGTFFFLNYYRCVSSSWDAMALAMSQLIFQQTDFLLSQYICR